MAYEINKTLHIEMLSVYIPYIYLRLIDVQVRLQVSNQSIRKIQNIKVVVVNLVSMLWVSIRNVDFVVKIMETNGYNLQHCHCHIFLNLNERQW